MQLGQIMDNKIQKYQKNKTQLEALVGDLGHLRAREESTCDQVGHGREGEGEEKLRWDGTGAPEGSWGRGEVPTLGGVHSVRGSARMEKDLWGIGGSEGNLASISPACSGPHKPAGALGLNTKPPPLGSL